MKLIGHMERYVAVWALLALAGCASVAPRSAGPVPDRGGHEKVASVTTESPSPAPASEPSRAASVPAPVQPESSAAGPAPAVLPAPVAPETRPADGDLRVLIESQPSGATVVINGRTAGRTPYTMTVAGTGRGFFREEQAVRVRFIATQASEVSATVEEVFAPTDRVPVRVVFTPERARRFW